MKLRPFIDHLALKQKIKIYDTKNCYKCIYKGDTINASNKIEEYSNRKVKDWIQSDFEEQSILIVI